MRRTFANYSQTHVIFIQRNCQRPFAISSGSGIPGVLQQRQNLLSARLIILQQGWGHRGCDLLCSQLSQIRGSWLENTRPSLRLSCVTSFSRAETLSDSPQEEGSEGLTAPDQYRDLCHQHICSSPRHTRVS